MLNAVQQSLVDALRSGKYKQASGRLHVVCEDGSTCNCCLGVAGLLYNEAHPDNPASVVEYNEVQWKDQDRIKSGVAYRIGSSPFYMDTRVAKYFGFKTDAGSYGEDGFRYLAWDNDNGASFEQIADIIEQNADTLFEKE